MKAEKIGQAVQRLAYARSWEFTDGFEGLEKLDINGENPYNISLVTVALSISPATNPEF